ncbi:hypothetical protein BIW16_07895 [Vibrio sp. OULL4]|nr:hypothetical protein BIW16_07895 [Vibrio sp. OULL4]
MSKVFRKFYEMNDHIEESMPVLDLMDEIEVSHLVVKGIYFRNMHLDSKHFIVGKRSQKITLMTYQVGKGFSKSALEIIKNSTSNTKIRIAFCLVKEKDNNEKNKEKNKETLNNITSSFGEIFEANEELTIELITNPQTHIKLLQYDNELFIGSMNFSKTADDIDDSVNNKHHFNYRNHELMVKFEGGESTADIIWDKLLSTKGSNSLTINKNNYKQNLSDAFNNSLRKTIEESKKEKESAEERLTNRHKELQQSVKKEVSKIFKRFFSEELNLDIDIIQEIETLDSTDLRSIYFYISEVDNQELMLNYILDSSTFLVKKIGCQTLESLLHDLEDIVEHELDEYEYDMDTVIESILDDRLDQDDGEDGIPFGPLSTKSLERFERSNDKVVINFIYEFIEYLARELVERDLCKVYKKSIY